MDESAPQAEVGYTNVDAQPEAARLVAGMEATAQWPAVRQLRRWEREHLALTPGDKLLDVGCGIGDAASALAADLAPGGAVLGIDASEAMIEAARARAAGTGDGSDAAVTFRVGDAFSLGEADGSFTAVRSERVLQWLADPAAAVAEMVRVLAPGGRLSLIDTDWRTLAADLPPGSGHDEIIGGMLRMRGAGAVAGARLLNLCRDAGLVDLDCTGAAHVWTGWDPDSEPGPSGLFPLRPVLGQLADAGVIDREVVERYLDAVFEAARADRFWLSLTMFAVSARKP